MSQVSVIHRVHALSPARVVFQDEAESQLPIVDLRPLKTAVLSLSPGHPLRILVSSEPDEVPREQYAAKAIGWFRLITARVD